MSDAAFFAYGCKKRKKRGTLVLQRLHPKSKVLKRCSRTEGVGARKSFICLFSAPFFLYPLRRRGTHFLALFWGLCRKPPPLFWTLFPMPPLGEGGIAFLEEFFFWGGGGALCVEEDKRATTNVQNRFAQFFLLFFLIFCSPRAETLCFEGESPGGKIMKKCEKL